MLCFHSPKSHKAWKMRNRITARWKFIDRADPENTNNYLNRNLTSFSQLIGSHACSPLCPCLPAEMNNWAKGVISKKRVLYCGDSTLTFPDGSGHIWEASTPSKTFLAPAHHHAMKWYQKLVHFGWSIHLHTHTLFSTPGVFKTHILNVYNTKPYLGVTRPTAWSQAQTLPSGKRLSRRKERAAPQISAGQGHHTEDEALEFGAKRTWVQISAPILISEPPRKSLWFSEFNCRIGQWHRT